MRVIFFIGIILTFLVSCASEQELSARKLGAFDISGSYQTSATSETSLQFDIENEIGNNDIVVSLTLPQAVVDTEKNKLNSYQVSFEVEDSSKSVAITSIFTEAELNTLFTSPILLGKGPYSDDNDDKMGRGENTSTDFGTTSTFNVCSTSLKRENAEHNIKVSLEYCMSGSAKKEGTQISGDLRLDYSLYDGSGEHMKFGTITSNSYIVPYQYRSGKLDITPCLENLTEEEREAVLGEVNI